MEDTKLIFNLYSTSRSVFIVPLMQTVYQTLQILYLIYCPPDNLTNQKGDDGISFWSQKR